MNRSPVSLAVIARAAALAILVTMIGVGDAGAALLAYDPFAFGDPPEQGEYALGDEDAGTDLLGGQNPLIGPTVFYAGAWEQSGGDSQVVKAGPSLVYPGLVTGKGGIQQESLQLGCCTFGRTGRPIVGGLGFGPARTIYQSFLIDFGSQGADDPAQFGFRGHELWNGGLGDSFFAVGLFVNHFEGIADLSLRVTTASASTTVPVAGGGLDLAALAGVHLVVIKYDFRPVSFDAVSVFLDPVVGAPEPVTADAQIGVAASDLFITHHGAFSNFTFSGGNHAPGTIDEIRWGDTFSDVTPFVCAPAPESTCTAAASARVKLQESKPGNEKLRASLRKFAVGTTQGDFGDPVGGDTRFALCLYDASDALALAAGVDRAGETCGTKPCWKVRGTSGFSYKDKLAAADGVKKVAARSGGPGKGSFVMQGRNDASKGLVSLPTGGAAALAGATSATLQMRASDGACFSAELTVRRAEGGKFEAKAP